MGLPVHFLNSKYRNTWVDTLRSELSGYATVESLRESENDLSTVYVVGNHGHFTLEPQLWSQKSGILILMFPFCCSVKRDGQGMYNLEERIHRVLDSMSVAFEPEQIEKYEKSRWTKFFRLFGWEHVGSLDFAHRKKREIIEGDDGQPQKTRQREFDPEHFARCKPEYETSWPDFFRERLRGKANVIFANESPHIVSPNGKYSVTVIRVKHGDADLELFCETQNGVCWLHRPFFSAESAIRTPVHWAAFKIFREITENEPAFEKQNEISKPHSIKTRIYGKTWTHWFGMLASGSLAMTACVIGPLFLFDVVKSNNGRPGYEAGILLTVFGLFFLLATVLLLRELWIRQRPFIRLCREGIEVLDLNSTKPDNYLQILTKVFRIPTVRLRWEEVDIISHKNESLGILGTPGENILPVYIFTYDAESFVQPIKKVVNILRYFLDNPQSRRELPDWDQ